MYFYKKRKHPKRTLIVTRNQQELHTIDSFLLVTQKNNSFLFIYH